MEMVIIWDVNPEIFNIGSFAPRWYSVLFATGFIIGYYIVKRMFKAEQVNPDWLDTLLVYLIIGTVLGARLGHCFFYDYDYYMNHPLEILLPVEFEPEFRFTGFRGLASHGGAIGIIVALYIFSRRVSRKSILWILDKVVVPTALAGMFIRLGNLMNSEILGNPTDVAWAFKFVRVDDIPRHPAQLYEAIGYLISFVVLYRMYWKTDALKKPGKIFGMFLVLIFGFRFLVEFVKSSQGGLEEEIGYALTTGQLLSIPFVLIGLYFVLRPVKRAA